METDKKKLERRAKALLLSKEIPPGKMDLVRSLMKNNELLPEERFSAIITLIQSCPDRIVHLPKPEPVEVAPERMVKLKPLTAQEPAPARRPGGPEDSSEFIGMLYRKYRPLRFFKKRYLIHANNRFGIGIKKRLVPSPRLLRALGDVIACKEKILTRLPDLFTMILNNESVESPLLFNYLRVFRKWMMQTPLIQYQHITIKWMDRAAFEAELKDFVLYFLSFQKLDIEMREQIISLVESTLRESDDLKKEIVNQKDPEHVIREKEKRNLARERQVYDFMTLMRSFLPADPGADSVISGQLRSDYGIQSYPHFLLMLMEVLVYWRITDFKEIESYYGIRQPAVSATEWDYSAAEIRKAGKDPESRRIKQIEELKQSLVPYEELYSLLEMKLDGRDVLLRGFEEQWKIVDRKQKDFEDIHEYNFFAFLDGCVNYFNNCFVPFLDGTGVFFEDRNRTQLEGRVFSEDYFRNELRVLSQIMDDLFSFKSGNPTLILDREEAKRIMQGKLRSMAHVEKLFSAIGALFYQIGGEIRLIQDRHRIWTRRTTREKNADPPRKALSRDDVPESEDTGIPIPWYDCRITGFEKNRPLSKSLQGRSVFDDISGGIIGHIAAFTFQLAYECMNDDILYDLDKRKQYLREIKELSGKSQ